eukprot:Anaeramoba_flamelloidesa326666_39.p1 GENE.a326666_39~~a326666_39.p1  ORF type:complete len:110 (+),score=0.27 a326666_39:132-461(+)
MGDQFLSQMKLRAANRFRGLIIFYINEIILDRLLLIKTCLGTARGMFSSPTLEYDKRFLLFFQLKKVLLSRHFDKGTFQMILQYKTVEREQFLLLELKRVYFIVFFVFK